MALVFTHFTERLADALDPNAPDMEADAEWPTIGYFLIYEMFSAMTDWIRLVEYRSANQANIVMENTRFVHENGNIPKSAIMVLTLCFRKVLLSDNIIPRFKRYIADIVVGLLKDLNDRPKLKVWSEMLVNALAAGDFGRTARSEQYQAKFMKILRSADISVRREAEMLLAAINNSQG